VIPFLLTPGHDIQPTVLELPDQARSFSKPVLSQEFAAYAAYIGSRQSTEI